MLSRFPAPVKYLGLALLTVGLGTPLVRGQAGIAFTASGPVNKSFGGAGVAAPIDAIGTLFWNPAATAGLPTSEMDFGAEILYPQSRLASSAPAMPFGPGGPTVIASGSTRGDDGVFPLPAMGLVYKPEGSNLTYGLGIFLIGGFGVNYPEAPTNPILSAQPPFGAGLGPIFAQLDILQLAPTVAVNITDRLAVGVGPTLDLSQLRADPFFLAPPNPNGAYSPGTHSRYTWGGGAQAGVYYGVSDGWRLGASVKSPQWFEDFRFQSVDSLGRPRTLSQNIDFPAIYSIGTSYAGIDRWLFAADLHYVDFANAATAGPGGYTPEGAARGLGWKSVFGVNLGAQYRMSDTLTLRGGYSWNQNPIDSMNTIFNVASPVIVEHTVYVGASYRITDQFLMSLAYAHAFQNSETGPIITPLGTVPASSVTNTASADSLLFGFTVLFGAHCDHHQDGTPAVVSGL